MIKELNLQNEDIFLKLTRRTPAEPLFYLLRIEDKINVDVQTYYKILQQKYQEENNKHLHKLVTEYLYILRDR